jgi:crossover junction endodeoxyribonuclease RuvC
VRYIAGIDPGLSGAIALYDATPDSERHGTNARFGQIIDMPTHELTINGKKKRRLDLTALARFADTYAKDIALLVIENVNAAPGQGVTSMFNFGYATGAVTGIFAANFVPLHPVSPQKWKRELGLSSDKDASRALASRMFPAAAHLWSRKKDDGRAESALLAWYGSKLKERGVV